MRNLYPCKHTNESCPHKVCKDMVDGTPIMAPRCTLPYEVSPYDEDIPTDLDFRDYCMEYEPIITPPLFEHEYWYGFGAVNVDEFCARAKTYLMDAHGVPVDVIFREYTRDGECCKIRIIISIAPGVYVPHDAVKSMAVMVGRELTKAVDEVTGNTYYYTDWDSIATDVLIY